MTALLSGSMPENMQGVLYTAKREKTSREGEEQS
jgi:hypothetical protein